MDGLVDGVEDFDGAVVGFLGASVCLLGVFFLGGSLGIFFFSFSPAITYYVLFVIYYCDEIF